MITHLYTRGRSRLLILSAVVLTTFAFRIAAQQYAIDWSTIDGGGGASSGGDFALSGTIGQHDAGGDLLGGDFAITGGFWSIATTVETPGAPSLTLSLAASTLTVAWPSNGSAGFVLEETGALANPSATWNAVNITPQSTNGTNSVSLPLVAGTRFYRLYKL